MAVQFISANERDLSASYPAYIKCSPQIRLQVRQRPKLAIPLPALDHWHSSALPWHSSTQIKSSSTKAAESARTTVPKSVRSTNTSKGAITLVDVPTIATHDHRRCCMHAEDSVDVGGLCAPSFIYDLPAVDDEKQEGCRSRVDIARREEPVHV